MIILHEEIVLASSSHNNRGSVANQPVRSSRLTNSAARTNVALFIHRAVRPRTPRPV